jgi:putative acetyltransferase
MITLRRFQPNDAEKLADVYRDAVRTIGSQAYDPPQIDAWVRSPEDIERFRTALSMGLTVIAEEAGEPIGFGQLSPPDHLALLYCVGRVSRRGLGSLIYDELEREAIRMGSTLIKLEASRISRAFFEKKGYHVFETEISVFLGVQFERFRMSKVIALVTSQPAPGVLTSRPHNA